MDNENWEQSMNKWQPGCELPFAVGIMADDEEGTGNSSVQRSGDDPSNPALAADLGLSKRWGDGDVWGLPSKSSSNQRPNRYPGNDSDWSTDLDDFQGIDKNWADEYIWNIPAESSVFNKDELLLDSEKEKLTDSSNLPQEPGAYEVSQRGVVGPGAYEVNRRAPGNLPSWFRRAPVRRETEECDDSIGDYSEYDDLENRWTRCIKLGVFLFVSIAAGLGIGLGVALTTSGDSSVTSGRPFGKGGDSTSQTLCNFTDVEQPDPFLQCSCHGEISVISEPLQNRYHELHQVFIPITLPEFNETKTSCTPRNVALMWLANDPLASNGDLTVMTNRFALALLYATWDGDTWKVKDRWLTPEPECTWSGVSCMLNFLVSELRFSLNLLKGPIPKEISLLDNLRVFDVSGNKLVGKIPDELYSISTLEQLVLWDNQLEGTINEKIGNLQNLRIVWLEKNKFSGTLPKSMLGLRKMMWFIVDVNYFNGPIFDSMLAWPDIVAFHCGYNSFADSFPSEIGNLSHLRSVDLSANDIQGTLPTELGRASNLELFIMDGHNLDGTIPTEIGNLANLANLGIMLGNLEGAIPTEFGKLQFLQDIVLSSNDLTGTIPSEFGLCTQLLTLDLSQNSVEGILPSELGDLSKLKNLALDWTKVTGIVPAEICTLREGSLQTFLTPCHGNFKCIPSSCCSPTCVR